MPLYRYKVAVYSPQEQIPSLQLPLYRDVHAQKTVVVVGSGPAGMFAALELLSLGLRPMVIERGKDVSSRKKDIEDLSKNAILNPESNYCFGEGGAGTFSDGKLYTRSTKRGDNMSVLGQFVRFGASESILYDAHPHIGSDLLPGVVQNIRECIISHGGQYRFSTKVCGLRPLEDGAVEVLCEGKESICAQAVILATGHSAVDVYGFLGGLGQPLQAKGFALGVRAEHPQSLINSARFHGKWRSGMPAAEYSFAIGEDGRGVFSFCMCPGGSLVSSMTEEGTMVLNGMSLSSRNGPLANSGVVVQINPEDISGTSPLRLLDFQRQVERDMYGLSLQWGGRPFVAPAQRMEDFVKGSVSTSLPRTSYPLGAVSAPLHEALPDFVANRLRKAFPRVPIPHYLCHDALVLGVESRTSSPVRIVRDDATLQASALPGVFPCGEGAGYSGGIVSSAIDGIRAARAAASLLAPR